MANVDITSIPLTNGDVGFFVDSNIRNIVGLLDEVSGNPATANTDSAGIGVQTVVDIEPKQDLHGYNYPWPAGGGKNKLPMTVDGIKSANTSGIWSENVYTISGGTIKISTDSDNNVTGFRINGTFTATVWFIVSDLTLAAGTYTLNGAEYVSDIGLYGQASTPFEDWISSMAHGPAEQRTFTSDVTGIIYLRLSSNVQYSNSHVYAGIYSTSVPGSTFDPYSNVCSISGYESVEVGGCGKNILPCTVEAIKSRNTSGTWDGLVYTAPNGVKFTISVDANSNVTGINVSCSSTTSGSIEFKVTEWTNDSNNLSNGTYVLSGSNNTNNVGIIANKVGGSGNNWYTVGNPIIEITDERKIGDVYIYVANGTPATNVTITPQIERGSTATTYEPYNPVTDLTIPLPETVYGGTLDVESGTLTVDRGFITFDGSNDEIISTYDDGELFMVDYANFGDLVPKKGIDGIPTNRISPSATRMGNAAFALYWRGLPSDVRTVEALRTWLASNNLQVCYELTTPYTISLSPHQIKLLQGVNNLSTNAHSVTLTYRKGKVVMNSDLEGLADGFNVLVDDLNVQVAKEAAETEAAWDGINRIMLFGRDLTVVFADEIADYSDEWAWIQARLNAHDVSGLRVGDYIPINIAANGNIAAETHMAEIAGINTYRRTGDSGHEVGYHIDWITHDCYSDTVQFNTTNINNGNASNSSPFLASNLKSWLDGTLYGLLDAKLKAVIKAKRILAPYRYQSGATLTDDNSREWQDFNKLWVPLEGEIFDSLVWSTKGFGNGQAVQYPIFANSYEHRIKGGGPGGARAGWWTASAYSGNSTYVVLVTNNGYSSYSYASGAFCVPVCFRTMEA